MKVEWATSEPLESIGWALRRWWMQVVSYLEVRGAWWAPTEDGQLEALIIGGALLPAFSVLCSFVPILLAHGPYVVYARHLHAIMKLASC